MSVTGQADAPWCRQALCLVRVESIRGDNQNNLMWSETVIHIYVDIPAMIYDSTAKLLQR